MEKTLRYCIGIDVDKKEFKANIRSLDSSGKQKTLATVKSTLRLPKLQSSELKWWQERADSSTKADGARLTTGERWNTVTS